MEEFYFSYKNYMKQEYGHVLYSVPVDLNFGCPNRESSGLGGCSFCPEDGARAIQSKDAKDIKEQIKQGIAFAKKRYKAHHFILYIQAYTGTFSSLKMQKRAYESLLSLHEFKALSIGTRPDCLSEDTLKYLSELNKRVEVSIDLGVQTLNDKTLEKINRGHKGQASLDAIKRLKSYGIKVFAHLIIGFEGEKREDWLNSVKELVKAGIDGIKFHNLHIIKNTQLAREYEKNPFPTLDEYEYAEELLYLLPFIPSHIPILRLCTDTLSQELIAPKWAMSKGEFLRFLTEQMAYRGIKQGDLQERETAAKVLSKEFITCGDGSISLWDAKYKNYYHPKAGAIKQARELFCDYSQIEEKLNKRSVKLLDMGFGMGYNTLEALKVQRKFFLHVSALEQNLQVLKQSAKLLENKELLELYEKGSLQKKNAEVKLFIGDVRHTLKQLQEGAYDIVFLDPFLHTQNTTMITLDVLSLVTKVLKQEGVLVASTNSQAVRAALSELGFISKVIQLPKSDIRGIQAQRGEQSIKETPYRDPFLVYRDKQIIHNRDREIRYNTTKKQ